MKIDMHTHTIYSGDSSANPLDLIMASRAVGLDGIVVTEHDSYKASAPLEELGKEEGFLVLRGAEARTKQGHLLVYGVKDDSFQWKKYPDMQEMINYVNSIGGVAIPSHPFKTGYSRYLGNAVFSLRDIPALETENANCFEEQNLDAKAAARTMKLKEIGSSDAHSPAEVGLAYTVFENSIKTIEDLVKELREGRYFPMACNDIQKHLFAINRRVSSRV